jgi:hypothetical protein
MACGGFLAMSAIEFAEESNQPRHRSSNTGAMTAKAAQLAFVRRAVASSVLGRAGAWVLSGLLACAVAAQADSAETSVDANASDDSEGTSSNAANNPVEPLFTLQYWNYYAPSLNNVSGDAENGEAKAIIPFTIAGVQQIMHIIPSLVTNPTTTSGPRTGLGDTQLYNFTLGHFDVGLPQKVALGLGPLVSRFRRAPTAISAQTRCRLAPQVSSLHLKAGVFSACSRLISKRCRESARM